MFARTFHFDTIITPTEWQKSQFPALIRDKITVLHEGIDTDNLFALKSNNSVHFPLLPGDNDIEVLTYVSRCFEEYRGFPQAIQTISKLQQLRPNLHVLIVGQDGQAYGNARSDGQPWSQWAKANLSLDPARTHWLGALQEHEYHNVLAISDVHLYLTVPFVLSWSLLEAMG